ncbi:MAG: endonuclease/exonuclease/phosphatase family protein [Cyanobacteriota bacterium]|jgi:endonuclease/exonuclease/phosphatase family metal-dependent hydrolase
MTEIKVAFWNVQNLFDTTTSPIAADLEFTPEQGWTEEVFAIKVANLAKIIKQMHGGQGPDLLGLCEVENQDVVERLMEAIGRPDYRLAHVEAPDIRGIDCSLLYSSHIFNDPAKDDIQGHLIYFRFPTRDIFQVRLTLKTSGSELNVFVNHWPSRSNGEYQSEPHRFTVGERCGQLVDDVLKFSRQEYLQIPETKDGLAQLNARWNRNILLMGDFNDNPFNRSITDYLQASKDFDKMEEEIKGEKKRDIPSIQSYLEHSPTLLNLSWPCVATPDGGSIFFSGDSANTMHMFDQFMVSRGLFYGKTGLKARPGSVHVLRPTEMATSPKLRPKAFDKKTKKGFSDHFPIEMVIDTI